MQPRLLLRIFAGLAYLGVLVAVVGAVLGRIAAFEGSVVVSPKRTESMAVRPSGNGAGFAMTRSMPLDVLPLDNPQAVRSLLDTRRNYDGLALGFRLRLDAVRILAPASERDVIEIKDPAGATVTLDARAGAVLSGHQGPLGMVRAVQPWAGLLRDPSGRRMAAFSFQRGEGGEWVQGLFAEAGQWTLLPPEMALRLDWDPTEEQAGKALPADRPGLDAARWSVAENGRVHWFENVTPGTGQTLADGTEYRLLSVNTLPPVPPALTVGIKKAGKARRVDVPANAASPKEGVRFECPGAMPVLIMARAWRDGAAWVASFGPEGTTRSGRMGEGDQWQAGPDLRFRLDQVMEQGLAVGVRGAPVWMAEVDEPEGTLLRLREGVSMRRGETTLRYRRLPQPPVVEYDFQALALSGKPIQAFTLRVGGQVRIRDWVFSQDGENLDAGKTALLVARRRPLSPHGLAGVVLLAFGAAGWMLIQIRRRRSSGPDASGPAENMPPLPPADG